MNWIDKILDYPRLFKEYDRLTKENAEMRADINKTLVILTDKSDDVAKFDIVFIHSLLIKYPRLK